jgi:hypothetical protein
VGGLHRGTPLVFVDADALPESFTVNPMCLDEPETEYVAERVRAHLAAA